MKRLVFLFISGTLMFINGGCGREDSSDLIKLESLKDCAGCNLIEAKLPYEDLKEADLSNANLSRADLSNAQLKDANLGHANLFGARLIGADLSYSNLENSILKKISIPKGAIFCNTKVPWGLDNSGC